MSALDSGAVEKDGGVVGGEDCGGYSGDGGGGGEVAGDYRGCAAERFNRGFGGGVGFIALGGRG